MNTQELKLAILEIVLAGRESPDHLEVKTLCDWAFEWITEPPAEEKASHGPHIVVGFPFPELDGLKLGELIERIRTDPNRPTIIQRYDAPAESPNVTNQTPEEVLRANGWNRYSDNPIGYTNPEEALKVVCGNGQRWFIQKVGAGHENNKPIYWNHEVSPIFEDWLCAQVAALPEMVANNTGVSPTYPVTATIQSNDPKTPEEILLEGGWDKGKMGQYITSDCWRKDGIIVFYNDNKNWGIRKDVKETTLPRFWDPQTQTFDGWLTSNVAALTEEKTNSNDALKDELPRFGWVRDPQSGMWSHRNSRCMLTLNDAEEWKIVRQNGHEMVVLDIYAPSQPFFEWLGKYVKADPTAAERAGPKTEARDENGVLSLDSRNDVLKRLGWVMKKGNPFKTQWEFPHLYAQIILETSSSSYKGHSDSNWDTHMPDLNSFLEWAQECTGATKTQLRELAHAMLHSIGEKP